MSFVNVDGIRELSFLPHGLAENYALFKEEDLELFPLEVESGRSFGAEKEAGEEQLPLSRYFPLRTINALAN